MTSCIVHLNTEQRNEGNAMSISATEKPLGKIFTSDYRFVIPSSNAHILGKRKTSRNWSPICRTHATTRTRRISLDR